MNVFMIGGTGLLGSQAARELLERGHRVRSLALPPVPEGAILPEGLELRLGNFMELGDDELRAELDGHDALVFAAGVDERVEGPPPIYGFFARYNIAPLERLLRLARECGLKRAAVCGSYFTHFDRIWPELNLARDHPYIRSRVDQERMALSFAEPGFDVAVLELPYIFGAQPGRKPVWLFLVERILGMKGATLYPRGGTAMVTVRQVGQCLAGALERNRGGNAYPIGWFNLGWRELLSIIHRHMGMPGRRVITIPDWLFAAYARSVKAAQVRAGHEGGLDLPRFSRVMCAETYIDKSLGCEPLGAAEDDLDAAIGQSVRLCMELLAGRASGIGMRGE